MVERWHQCNQARKKLDITDQAYQKAREVLVACVGPTGIKASADEGGYPQVWARDSMIAQLGAAVSPSEELKAGSKRSLQTLGNAQTHLGQIPSNVICRDGKKDFRAYIDGNMLYVMGHKTYSDTHNDEQFLQESWPKVKKTLDWLDHQDVYQKGLIAQQEGSDWTDQMPAAGLVLYSNVLYYKALRDGSTMAEKMGEGELRDIYTKRAVQAKNAIQENFWVDIKQKFSEDNFADEEDNIVRGQWHAKLRERPHFVWYKGFRNTSGRLETLGNTLAIMTGVASREQSNQILDFADQVGMADPYPAKALYHTIHPGDTEWRDYMLNRNLNLPDQYHNGGIWPMVGGFYVASLVKAERYTEAETQLEKLAKFNQQGRKGEWEFNEWGHGVTGRPMGVPRQGWSASMYLYAHEAVKQRKVPFFDETEMEQV